MLKIYITIAAFCFLLCAIGVLNRISYNVKKKKVGVTESETKSSSMFLGITIVAFLGGVALLVIGFVVS